MSEASTTSGRGKLIAGEEKGLNLHVPMRQSTNMIQVVNELLFQVFLQLRMRGNSLHTCNYYKLEEF